MIHAQGQVPCELRVSYGPRDIGTPFPWSQGPSRIGIGRENGALWMANSWSGTLVRVDARARGHFVTGWPLDTNISSEVRRPKPEPKVIALVSAQPFDLPSPDL
jgi:hypothetical protein